MKLTFDGANNSMVRLDGILRCVSQFVFQVPQLLDVFGQALNGLASCSALTLSI